TDGMPASATGIGTSLAWEEALEHALVEAGAVGAPDLAFVFASSDFGAHYGEIVLEAGRRLGARHLIGCSGQGIIATGREIEQEPAIVVLSLSLPGARLTPLRFAGHAS